MEFKVLYLFPFSLDSSSIFSKPSISYLELYSHTWISCILWSLWSLLYFHLVIIIDMVNAWAVLRVVVVLDVASNAIVVTVVTMIIPLTLIEKSTCSHVACASFVWKSNSFISYFSHVLAVYARFLCEIEDQKKLAKGQKKLNGPANRPVSSLFFSKIER